MFLQKIGENYVKFYKYELLRHMTDMEDAAAWLIVWSVPVGRLTVALRRGGDLNLGREALAPVFSAGKIYFAFYEVRCFMRCARCEM